MKCWMIPVFVFVAQFSEVSSNPLSYYRVYNSIDIYWSYCGPQMLPFDPHTHICCKDYIRPLLGPWYVNRCCGSLPYNRRTHWCCRGKVRRNYLNSVYARPRCCGRSSYNPIIQTCCAGVVTTTKVPSYLPSACCGRQSYNPFKQTCCQGEVQSLVGGFRHTQCCGARSINTKLEKCCNGVVQYMLDPLNDGCCGKSLFRGRYDKCCDNKRGIVKSRWTNCPTGNAIENY